MLACVACSLILGTHLAAFQTGRRASGTKLSKQATCASDLGAGVKSNRSFCDVIVATRPEKSVAMTIPTHTGTATLMFDLHNRFSASATTTDPAQAFQRHSVIVAVIKPTGDVIDRARRHGRVPDDPGSVRSHRRHGADRGEGGRAGRGPGGARHDSRRRHRHRHRRREAGHRHAIGARVVHDAWTTRRDCEQYED